MIEKIKKILGNQLGISVETIKSSDHLTNDLHADSLDLVEIVMELEKAFNIRIEEDEYHKADTVELIGALVTSKLTK